MFNNSFNIGEIDYNGNNNSFPFYDEFFSEKDKLYFINGHEIVSKQKKDESKLSNDSTKGTYPKKKENNEEIKLEIVQKKEVNKKGRKTKNSESPRNHDKYMDDNIRRKIKYFVLKSLLEFINEEIKKKYNNGIGKGVFTKQLKTMNKRQNDNSTVLFNIEFLKKPIGEIFSDNISTRYTKYPLNHNKKLIDSLKNDEEINKRNYFIKLFDLRFQDILEHFRGNKVIAELNGMKTFDSIKEKFNNDVLYLKLLEYSIKNYEKILEHKRIRRGKNEN